MTYARSSLRLAAAALALASAPLIAQSHDDHGQQETPAVPAAQRSCPKMGESTALGGMQQHMAEMRQMMQQLRSEMQAMRDEMKQMHQERPQRR